MKKLILAPCLDQTVRWVNGCESVSAVMLLRTVGVSIEPDAFIAQDLPKASLEERNGVLCGPDPHGTYAGDPCDPTGFGCYAPCIVQAVQHALDRTGAADCFEVVDETGTPAEELCRYIDAGLPVVFWTTLDFDRLPGAGSTGSCRTAPILPGVRESTVCCWWATMRTTTGSTIPTARGCAGCPKRRQSSAMPCRETMPWPCAAGDDFFALPGRILPTQESGFLRYWNYKNFCRRTQDHGENLTDRH